MERISFIFTIFFILLGPVKIIPAFAGLMQGSDIRFKRAVAIRGTLIAAVTCFFVVLAGATLLSRFRIHIDAVRIAGGLILLLASLNVMFTKMPSLSPNAGALTALQLAVSPVAVPIIVPHAGVAALLIFVLQGSLHPDMVRLVLTALAIMMALDFLVMYYIDQVIKTPGLMLVLAMLGSVLVFMQACLAVQIILVGLKQLSPIQF